MSEHDSTCALPDLPNVAGVQFRHVEGFPGYCVGDDGTVLSMRSRRYGLTGKWSLLKPTKDRHGYLYVDLKIGGRVRKYVHTLVLESFIGPRPPGADGRHDPDPTPTNNRPCNLKWGTRKENMQDAIRHGTWMRGERANGKLTDRDIVAIREMWKRHPGKSGVQAFLARWFGLGQGTVSQICARLRWKHIP